MAKGWSFSLSHAKLTEIWLVLFIPFIPFIIYDVVSTYYGVCLHGGYEMSSFALWLVPKIHYIPASILLFASYAFGTFGLAWLLEKFKHHDVWKIFLLVFWSLALLSYLQGFMINTNTLVYIHTNHTLVNPHSLVKTPPAELHRRAAIFHSVKKDFCKLI